jgi:hypothetical protein
MSYKVYNDRVINDETKSRKLKISEVINKLSSMTMETADHSSEVNKMRSDSKGRSSKSSGNNRSVVPSSSRVPVVAGSKPSSRNGGVADAKVPGAKISHHDENEYKDEFDEYSGSDEESRPFGPPPAFDAPHIRADSLASNLKGIKYNNFTADSKPKTEGLARFRSGRPVSTANDKKIESKIESTASRHKTEAHTDCSPKAGTAKASNQEIENRAQDRKKRIDLLQKQAADRVALKNQQLNAEKR